MNITIYPKKLKGSLRAIPSKSHAHRLLLAQKLARLGGQTMADPFQIPAFSADIEATLDCLAQLDEAVPVLDCRESGSTFRFLLPVTMALKDRAFFLGSGKLPNRPLSPLKEEMEAHGVRFVDRTKRNHSDGEGTRKICTVSGRLASGHYQLAGNVSSQFITGLLFALPLLDGDSQLELTTPLESAGYVDLTLDVLRTFGIHIDIQTKPDGFLLYQIPGGQQYVEPSHLQVEGDWSNACFWLACGALGGNITITGLNMDSSQRDRCFVEILQSMGASVTAKDGAVTVTGPGQQSGAEAQDADSGARSPGGAEAQDADSGAQPLSAATVSIAQTPDMAPVLAVVMCAASGTSRITNAERLRIKESDRLQTISETLSALGAEIQIEDTDLVIKGSPQSEDDLQNGITTLRGGTVSSYNDHRIAMAAAVASCICREPVTILDAGAVAKSYPNFWEDFQRLGGQLSEDQ